MSASAAAAKWGKSVSKPEGNELQCWRNGACVPAVAVPACPVVRMAMFFLCCVVDLHVCTRNTMLCASGNAVSRRLLSVSLMLRKPCASVGRLHGGRVCGRNVRSRYVCCVCDRMCDVSDVIRRPATSQRGDVTHQTQAAAYGSRVPP